LRYRDWWLPAVVAGLVVGAFAAARAVDWGPPDDWTGPRLSLPNKYRAEARAALDAARTGQQEPPTPARVLLGRAREMPVVGRGDVGAPVWSPDGHFIASQVSDGGEVTLQIVHLDALPFPQARAVTVSGATAYAPSHAAWQDHGLFLFSAQVGDEPRQLYWSSYGRDDAAEAALELEADPGAPFVREGTVALTSGGAVYTWELASGSVDQWTSGLARDEHPTLSPDRDLLALTRTDADGADVLLVDLATGVERPLAAGAGDQSHPAWCGDSQVAYLSDASHPGSWDLVVGPGERLLVEGVVPPSEGPPGVSPDGAWIAVVREGARSEVHLVRLDGTYTVEVDVEVLHPRDPVLAEVDGELTLAVTGLWDAEATQRRLYVVELGEGP